MSHRNPSCSRFSIPKHFVWIALLLFLPVGCSSIGSTPTGKNGLLSFPGSQEAAFKERVEADPFPDASQTLGNSLKSQTL